VNFALGSVVANAPACFDFNTPARYGSLQLPHFQRENERDVFHLAVVVHAAAGSARRSALHVFPLQGMAALAAEYVAGTDENRVAHCTFPSFVYTYRPQTLIIRPTPSPMMIPSPNAELSVGGNAAQ
jgi:hypothetical protein